jgi:uncharacterized protein (DUF2384 family)
MATQLARQTPQSATVLTEAVRRVAQFWKLTNQQLGAILGVSIASAGRLREGKLELDSRTKAFEVGQYLVRLFRSLDALMGSDDQAAREWLRTPNLDLEQRPIELLSTFTGLARVCDYVDAFRARV